MRALALALLLGVAAADEIVLKSGGRISCEVVEVRETTVLVRLPNGSMEIERSRIEAIVREASGDYLGREATGRLRTGSAESAVALFERALREDPSSAVARAGLLDALLAHGSDLAGRFLLDEAWAASERMLGLAAGHEGARGLRRRIEAERAENDRIAARARDLLERADFEGALPVLEGWRLRRPPGDPAARSALAAAHIGCGNARLRAEDPRGAIDHFRAAASYGESRRVEEALFLLRPVSFLEALRNGETAEARRQLDSISTTYPDPAVPLFLKAVLHHVTGRVEEAIRAYAEAERVAERAPGPRKGLAYEVVKAQASAVLRAAVARPPQEGASRWRETFLAPLRRDASARHFVVYAPTDRMARDLSVAADRLFGEIARDLLGTLPEPHPIELVVHASRQAYLAADQVPPGSPWAAIMISREKTGGVCYDTLDEKGEAIVRIEVYSDAASLLEDTLPHEITHAVQRRGLAVYRRAHWLDEALAMQRESEASRARRIAGARRAPAMIPLPELLSLKSTPPDRMELFYDQACALAEFLRARGSASGWRRFLDAFARGPVEAALRDACAIGDLDTLERLFRDWLAAGR